MRKINLFNISIFFLILAGIFFAASFIFYSKETFIKSNDGQKIVIKNEEIESKQEPIILYDEKEILPEISLIPNQVIQGEPVLIQINNINIIDIEKITFDNKKLNIFDFSEKPSALIGIDLNKKIGDYNVSVFLKDGNSTSTKLTIKEREKYEEPLPIPDSLGGNSPQNQTKVVNTLSIENTLLASLSTGAKAFWQDKFIYPIKDPVITDTYGYSRGTGNYNITHKGVDFRAKEGTEVYAMNRGVVRLANDFTVYGKTIVIDHGFGLMTYYMHLSKFLVNEGQLVLPGQIIALSGATGMSTGPHLHISVKIEGVSIDPIKFLEIFK